MPRTVHINVFHHDYQVTKMLTISLLEMLSRVEAARRKIRVLVGERMMYVGRKHFCRVFLSRKGIFCFFCNMTTWFTLSNWRCENSDESVRNKFFYGDSRIWKLSLTWLVRFMRKGQKSRNIFIPFKVCIFYILTYFIFNWKRY